MADGNAFLSMFAGFLVTNPFSVIVRIASFELTTYT